MDTLLFYLCLLFCQQLARVAFPLDGPALHAVVLQACGILGGVWRSLISGDSLAHLSSWQLSRLNAPFIMHKAKQLTRKSSVISILVSLHLSLAVLSTTLKNK